MSETLPQIELPLSRNHIAVRHPAVRHPIQRRASDQQLSGLSFEGACADPFAKDRLDSKNLRLCQRPPMIARLTFPLSPTLLSDLSQVLITKMSFRFRVAMLPNLRSLLRRN